MDGSLLQINSVTNPMLGYCIPAFIFHGNVFSRHSTFKTFLFYLRAMVITSKDKRVKNSLYLWSKEELVDIKLTSSNKKELLFSELFKSRNFPWKSSYSKTEAVDAFLSFQGDQDHDTVQKHRTKDAQNKINKRREKDKTLQEQAFLNEVQTGSVF
jgi:hypothetical protein